MVEKTKYYSLVLATLTIILFVACAEDLTTNPPGESYTYTIPEKPEMAGKPHH